MKKKAWSWSAYLEEEKAVAAPLKLFKEVKPADLVVSFLYLLMHLLLRMSVCVFVYVFVAAPVLSSEQEWV